MNKSNIKENMVITKQEKNTVMPHDESEQAKTTKSESEENIDSKLPEKHHNLEDILSDLKLSGRYHIRFLLLISIIFIISSGSPTNYIFTAENVGLRCKFSNCTYTELLLLEQNSTLDFRCHKYNLLYDNGTCTEDNFDVSTFKDCSEWEYEDPNSFVAQFDIGCEDWKRTLVGTVHSVGFMIGLLFMGPMADKFGRKKIIIFNALTTGVVGILKSLVTSYWIFIALEMLEPMFGDSHVTVHTLIIEMVTTKGRPATILVGTLAIAVAEFLMIFMAYISPNWRIFLVLLYTPSFLSLLCIFWLDESLRWLLVKGRTVEIQKIIRKAAKFNNIVIDESKIVNLTCEEKSSTTLWDSLKVTISSRKLFTRLIICICIWFTGLFNVYTLLINSVAIEGNKYINYGLVSLTGAASGAILLYVLTKFKRKGPFIFSLILTGVFCVSQSFIPQGYTWLSTLLYMCGKLNSVFTIKMAYLYTTELFPTYTRNTMLALCSSLGRIGAILAPLTPLLITYWSGLPAFLVGILSLATAFIVTLMPDTSEDVLPDNVQQAEDIGSNGKKKKFNHI